MKESVLTAVTLIAFASLSTLASAQMMKPKKPNAAAPAAAPKPAAPKPTAQTVEGKVVSLDLAKNEVVIKDNKTGLNKIISASLRSLSALKAGDEVKITLKAGSTNTADSVKVKVAPQAVTTY